MDRHDVSDSVTAEHIARLHQQDLAIQDQFGCRGLTYWFDEKRKTAFCLIEAPHQDAIRQMHDFAHGEVPYQVIEVDAGVVESFLGRIEDPEKTQHAELNIINDPAFRAIMVIDLRLEAYGKAGVGEFRTGLRRLVDVVPGVLRRFDGSLVKRSHEHFLISFRAVSNAVHAALAFRDEFSGLRNAVGGGGAAFKIGLSTGVPVTDRNLIFEEAIRLADRMVMAGKDTIVVSAEIRELYESEHPDGFAGMAGIFCLSAADEQFITRLMDHAERTWTDARLKVEDINREVGYSKPQLYRKMIQLTGKSPVTFINDYRLGEALSLLNKDGGNISQIAYQAGFSSPSYFAKCFQKRFGLSPTEYLAFSS